jgi:chromosome partitioning protein
MLIAFCNQKGGVSKSTLACHLAIWLFDQGVRVGFMDTDEQQTSAKWLQNAEPQLTVLVATEVDAIREAKAQLASENDIVVADTPGSGGDASHCIALIADLVVVPLQPSKPDLRAIKDSLKYVRLAQEMSGGKRPEVSLVLTFTAKGDVQSRKLRAELEATRLPVLKSEIRRLNAFRDACDSAVTRQSTREATEAAKDVIALFTELLGGRFELALINTMQRGIANA